MSTPADDLREAAQLLRERAGGNEDYVALDPAIVQVLAGLLDFFADRWVDDKAVKHYATRAHTQEQLLSLARLYLGRST